MASSPQYPRALTSVGESLVDKESELLARARRGERAAQAKLFHQHRDRVARQLLRMTGDPNAVDDLLQEVFIAVFNALPGFRGDAQLETWMYTIAANKVRNWWDSSRRRRRRESRAGEREQPLPTTPEEELAKQRHRARLYAALGELPHKYREAFAARVIEGMTLKDASKALGVGISTLSYRTRKAEQLLCEALGLPGRKPS